MEAEQNRKQLVISCGMLSNELKKAYQKCFSDCKILWMKRALHNHPKSLKDTLQSFIDENQDCDDILLTYGLCGNGTLGIHSQHTRLVIPKFHDCIHQLIQSVDNNTADIDEPWKMNELGKINQKQVLPGQLYLTRSWTLDQEAIYQQSKAVLNTYGKSHGQDILDEIYEGYTDINVINTDSYEIAPVMEYAKNAAAMNHLKVNQINGSTLILEKLLCGDWDQNFIVLEPGEELQLNHFFNI